MVVHAVEERAALLAPRGVAAPGPLIGDGNDVARVAVFGHIDVLHLPDVGIGLGLEHLAQLVAGRSERPVVAGEAPRDACLVRIELALQIWHLAAPDVLAALARAAVAGVVDRVGHQLTVVVEIDAARLLRRRVGALIGGRHALVCLTVHRRADIEACAAVPRLRRGVGARADRLRLERFERPVVRHLRRNDALDVILDIQHVDDADVAAGRALVFEAAVVAVAGEPRHRLLPAHRAWADAEAAKARAVELKEDGVRIRDRHDHAGAARRYDLRAIGQHIRLQQHARGLIVARVVADAHTILPVDVGDEALRVALRHRKRLLVAAERREQLNVAGAEDGGVIRRPRLIAHAAGNVGVAVHRNGDPLLIRRGERNEAAVGIVIAELVAGAAERIVVVLQPRRKKSVRAVF